MIEKTEYILKQLRNEISDNLIGNHNIYLQNGDRIRGLYNMIKYYFEIQKIENDKVYEEIE